MIANEFSETFSTYENFMILAVGGIEEFFEVNDVLPRIFKDFYKFPVTELKSRRQEIAESDMDIIVRTLSNVDDKHFFIFTLHDSNHLDLIKMQMMKVMNFGMDIQHLESNKLYILAMDRKKNTDYGF
ncbi:MAG: hypothetical protein IT233_09360 [Bacteroidia bacterium]|nr:hypothetical protein [Bacteroidia bacterium]